MNFLVRTKSMSTSYTYKFFISEWNDVYSLLVQTSVLWFAAADLNSYKNVLGMMGRRLFYIMFEVT